jgi:hypothetical protein
VGEQHDAERGPDLENVRAPAAAEEYARRLAQRGVAIAVLLRAYRIGSARFEEWCLQELGRQTDDAAVVSAAGMRIAGTLNSYIDRVSEDIVSAYVARRRNGCGTRAPPGPPRVRALLGNEQPDVDASEAILGYRLRQHHVEWWPGSPGRQAAVTRSGFSTGCARPRRASATPSPRTGCASNWPCSPPSG